MRISTCPCFGHPSHVLIIGRPADEVELTSIDRAERISRLEQDRSQCIALTGTRGEADMHSEQLGHAQVLADGALSPRFVADLRFVPTWWRELAPGARWRVWQAPP
jgi:hypothetical protein